MKNISNITARLDKPQLLEHMVEKLAMRHQDTGYVKTWTPKSFRAIETSSIEMYVSGSVEFDIDNETMIRMSFVTGFMFTCSKEKQGSHKLSWSQSLS